MNTWLERFITFWNLDKDSCFRTEYLKPTDVSFKPVLAAKSKLATNKWNISLEYLTASNYTILRTNPDTFVSTNAA